MAAECGVFQAVNNGCNGTDKQNSRENKAFCMFESVERMGCKTRGVGWAGEKCGIAKGSCIAAMAQ